MDLVPEVNVSNLVMQEIKGGIDELRDKRRVPTVPEKVNSDDRKTRACGTKSSLHKNLNGTPSQ